VTGAFGHHVGVSALDAHGALLDPSCVGLADALHDGIKAAIYAGEIGVHIAAL